jgi:hypothetical protein
LEANCSVEKKKKTQGCNERYWDHSSVPLLQFYWLQVLGSHNSDVLSMNGYLQNKKKRKTKKCSYDNNL